MPTLYLVDGYALIYRAFFAMIARPLTTRRGENTSAAWGVTNFLLRLLERRRPDYLAWVHDVGKSFRHRTAGSGRGLQVVIVSGDKDFYQLIAPGIALLNPGRGGPAAVEEHWVDQTNAGERLGVPPERGGDYLAPR